MRRTPLSPVLRTWNEHFMEQSRRREESLSAPLQKWERERKRWAPPAPMPEDPRVCRWCQGTRKLLANGIDYCQNLCASNDSTPFVGHCSACGRQFETGQKDASMCHGCDTRQHEAMKRNPHGTGVWRDDYRERRRRIYGEEK